LKGSTLTYFRGERDTQFPPRGQIDLTGTCLELEGLKRRRHWTWQIVDKQVGGWVGGVPGCLLAIRLPAWMAGECWMAVLVESLAGFGRPHTAWLLP
jgi:hypothetical protein